MIGNKYFSNENLLFTVKSFAYEKNKNKYYECIFEEVNGVEYICTACASNIISGKIKNPYHNSVFGVARLGMKNAINNKIILSKWTSMISRCYNPKNSRYKYYGGKGIYVCDRWLNFKNFLDDFILIQGYNEEKLLRGELHLDKDIIGNRKYYSLNNCKLTSLKNNNKEMNMRTKQKMFIATRIDDGYTKFCFNQLEFSKEFNIDHRKISDCLHGRRKSHKGWTFKFTKEEL